MVEIVLLLLKLLRSSLAEFIQVLHFS